MNTSRLQVSVEVPELAHSSPLCQPVLVDRCTLRSSLVKATSAAPACAAMFAAAVKEHKARELQHKQQISQTASAATGHRQHAAESSSSHTDPHTVLYSRVPLCVVE